MKREYIVFALLFVVLIINTASLWVHPAYRYYKNNMAALEQKLIDKENQFELAITQKLLPAIYQSITNTAKKSELQISQTKSTLEGVALPFVPERKELDIEAHFYHSGGRSFVNFKGFQYAVGDIFDGSPILSLSPFRVVTQSTDYRLSEINKNVSKD